MPPPPIQDVKASQRRDFLGWELALPLLIVIIMLLPSALIWKIPFFWALIAGWIVAFGVARRAGYNGKELLTASWIGIRETRIVIIVVAMIGALIAAWFLSGTIPTLVFHSLSVVIPKYLPLWAFIAAALVSILIGTALGTLGTVGIALMAVGQSLDVPVPLLAGALVSGAFVGDRTSIVSSAFHLLAQTTGMTPIRQLKVLMKTTLLALGACVLYFLIAGLTLPPQPMTITETVLQTSRLIQETWQIGLWALVPAFILFAMALGRLPVLWCLTAGASSALVVSILHQGVSVTEIAHAIWVGYQPESELQGILSKWRGSGGIRGHVDILLLLIVAAAFNGILSRTDMLRKLFQTALARVRSDFSLVVFSALLSILAGLVTCNQALTILVPGQLLRPLYTERGLSLKFLSRTLADSGLVLAGLIPWNLLALVSATAIGVSPQTYTPYAVFLWILPLISLWVSKLELRRPATTFMQAPFSKVVSPQKRSDD